MTELDMDELPTVNGRPMYYRLDEEHNVVGATRGEMLAVYNGDFETTRRVGQDEVDGQRVSTVFLGLDHNFHLDGLPVVFETMVFGGKYDEYQWRYSTWAEAVAGHERIVTALQAGEDPE